MQGRAPAAGARPRPVDLAELFPAFVATAMAPLGSHTTSPFAEERQAVARAVSDRRSQFFGGRACARAALGSLGYPPAPLGVGPGREPLWPNGVVGSISHGGAWCGAVAARASEARGLGLDVEVLDPVVSQEVEHLVHTAEERRALPSSSAERHRATTVAFGAKECVYKCLFPLTGWRLELHDVTVGVDLAGSSFRARLADDQRHEELGLQHLDGRFTIADGHVFTGLCLPAG